MSARRRAVRDDRWDRTPGGLFVPRRPTLPTRRFIQWLGVAKDCCEGGETVCPFCVDHSETPELTLTLTGVIAYRYWLFGNLIECFLTIDDSYALPRDPDPLVGIWTDTFNVTGGTGCGGVLELSITFLCDDDSFTILTTASFTPQNGGLTGPTVINFVDAYDYTGSGSGDCMTRAFSEQGSPLSCTNVASETADGYLLSAAWSDFSIA